MSGTSPSNGASIADEIFQFVGTSPSNGTTFADEIFQFAGTSPVEEIMEFAGLHDVPEILDRPGLPRFADLVRDALTGGLDLTAQGIFSAVGEIIFGEFIANGGLIRQLVVIAILGALMSCLTEAFKHKSAGETGFYVTYLLAVLLAVSSFYIVVDILNGLVSLVSGVMIASVPLMIGLMVLGGNFAGAAGFHPMLYFAFGVVAWFISAVFIPLVFASAALDIAGQISAEGHRLAKLSELLRKIGSWSLKGILMTFAFLLTLQRISAPIITNATLRTSRSLAGAVPVVGNAFTAAVDTVVNFSQAARSGVLVALVIVLIFAVAAPLLKMFALAFIYRTVAAFLQPVADKRLVSLMDGMGKHMAMLFNAAAMLGVLCIYVVVILLSF